MTEVYVHARHVDRVVKASKTTCGAKSLLLEICRRADYKKPESTFTKPQIVASTGMSMKTVVRGLRELRAEGSIVPILGFEGGKGKPVTYRLCIVGQGAETPRDNPKAGRGPQFWLDALAELRAIDKDLTANWFAPLSVEAVEGDLLTLKAKTRLGASHVRTHHHRRILDVVQAVSPDIKRLNIN